MGLNKEKDDIMILGDLLEKYNSIPHKINEEKIRFIKDTFSIAKNMFRGTSVRVDMVLHEPWDNDGVISITGARIDIDKPELFREIMARSRCVEIATLGDGLVYIDLGFKGLTYITPEAPAVTYSRPKSSSELSKGEALKSLVNTANIEGIDIIEQTETVLRARFEYMALVEDTDDRLIDMFLGAKRVSFKSVNEDESEFEIEYFKAEENS